MSDERNRLWVSNALAEAMQTFNATMEQQLDAARAACAADLDDVPEALATLAQALADVEEAKHLFQYVYARTQEEQAE